MSLKNCLLFYGFEESEIDALLQLYFTRVVFAAKEPLVLKNSPNTDTLFIIISGEAEAATSKSRVVVFKSGDIIGEMGFVTAKPRTVKVTARKVVEAWVLTRERAALLEQENPSVMMTLLRNIIRILAERIVADNAKDAELSRELQQLQQAMLSQQKQEDPKQASIFASMWRRLNRPFP